MHLSSHDRRRPAPAAPAAASNVGTNWLPIVAAAAQLIPSACTAWLLLHQRSFAAAVAAIVCGAVCCAVTVVAVARWYRRAMTVAVRSAVLETAQDPLTGLPTRAVLERALDRADAADAMFTVALADVDGLHDINTRWGHAAGDQYLAAIADRLAGALPAHGLLVRQGGDELTIVYAGGDAVGLRARITAALAAPTLVAGRQVPLRASVGIAVGTPAAVVGDVPGRVTGAARHVLACADTAMYTAKHDGGGQVLVYRPDRDGQPALDGTRPLLRRRDARPDGDGRMPVYVNDTERHLLRRLVRNAAAARHEQLPLAAGDATRLLARLAPAANSRRCDDANPA